MALPYLMVYFEKPVYNFAMFWPLKHDTFYPGTTKNLPELYVMYSIVGAFFLVPALTFLFGKRWYCSWACGCGGLAETAGDSFRHLSNKSTNAWRFERYSIHLVLLFVIINTILVIIHFKLRAELGASYTTEFPTFSSIAVGRTVAAGNAHIIFDRDAKAPVLLNNPHQRRQWTEKPAPDP